MTRALGSSSKAAHENTTGYWNRFEDLSIEILAFHTEKLRSLTSWSAEGGHILADFSQF